MGGAKLYPRLIGQSPVPIQVVPDGSLFTSWSLLPLSIFCFNYFDYCNYCNHFDYCHYSLFDTEPLVGVDRLADCIRVRPQHACSLCHSNTKHSEETASCPRRRHADHSTLPPGPHRLSRARRTRGPQAGIGR